MEMVLAVVANAANLSAEGNLNLLGIFDTVPVTDVPVLAPPMVVVYTIRIVAGDALPVGLTVEMIDDDDQLVVRWNSAIIASPPRPGSFHHLHLVVTCPRDLTLPKFSSYRVRLLAGDLHLGSALFQVIPRDPS